ncbi:MAG: 3-isopropylmalate dehydratase large subunit [Caulobacterales bacterium]|nr:3-isopropylmalate dehydratase large subunit [Caulobacterales bacterium]
MAGHTLVEKILARAAGRASVAAGEMVTIAVDLAMAHDSSGPRRWRARLEQLGAGLWDPDKVVLVSDHYVPAVDLDSAEILRDFRAFARDYGVRHVYDMRGICHAILPEHGHLRPGMVVAGGDSHTPHAGAFGCYAAGFGATDMTAIVATGETWTVVPGTVRVDWRGALAPGVTAKDMMLALCRDLGMGHHFKAMEYDGPAVRALPMGERMVLSNMAAELGAETGLIAPDAETIAHIRAHGGLADEADAQTWRSDDDAVYDARHRFDAGDLAPQVAAPHSPANAADVGEAEPEPIDQAYIGACVGAKLEDLRMAARVLRGRAVAAGTRLLVAPSTTAVTEAAAKEGTLAALAEAGAIIMPSGCGACAGLGAGVLADGETCISSTNRNFQGRMGHAGARVFLGSPYTVAASAVAGRIADPRPMLADAKEAA